MKHKQRLGKLEQRLHVEPDVIGINWQDKPDEIKTNGEVMSHEAWDAKYPDAINIVVRWDI